MAERRMFAKTIIDSDAFCDMPQSTQNLYFHLCMRADDDGFINNPKKIQREVNCSDDDMKILYAKNFIIPFESGVVVIKHWRMHNYLRSDRYKATVYVEEKEKLEVKGNGAYTYKTGIPMVSAPVYQCETQDRLGKDRLGEDREEASLPAEAFALAKTLNDLHLSNIDPKAKRADSKTLFRWAEDISKLNRIDGRTWEEIEDVIRWVKTPGQFWAPNIMSGKKLREKFDTITAQMKRGGSVKAKERPGLEMREG
jgi:hypothetical protein